MTTLKETISSIISDEKVINYWKEIKNQKSELQKDDLLKLNIAIEVIEIYENLIDHVLQDFWDVINIKTNNPT